MKDKRQRRARSRSPRLALLRAGLLLAGFGCSSGGPGQQTQSPACSVSEELLSANRVCTADDQCPCGTHCEYGHCAATCRSSADCRDGELCDRFGECRTEGQLVAVGPTRPEETTTLVLSARRQRVTEESPGKVFVKSTVTTRARVVPDPLLEVRCDEGEPFVAECFTDVSPEGSAFDVRPRSDADPQGDRTGLAVVRVFPKHGGARLLSVQLDEHDALPPFDDVKLGGQYAGTATLVALGGLDGEVGTNVALGAQVVVDFYPGAQEQIVRLRDLGGTMVPGGELVGRLSHAQSGATTLTFPPVLHLSRGTSGPQAVEVVSFPQVEGLALTKTEGALDLVLGLSGLTTADTPRQRWRLSLARVSDAPSGAVPTIGSGRSVQLPVSRADVPFPSEPSGAPPGLQPGHAPGEAVVLSLCETTELSESEESPLSGDVGCADSSRFFGLDYLQSADEPREQLLERCVTELSAAADGTPSESPVCVDVPRVLWAVANGAALAGSTVEGEPSPLLAQRVLAQWFGLSQFVATQGQEHFRFKAMITEGELRQRSAYLDVAYDHLDAAWVPFWWVLTPRWGQLLFSALSPEALAAPDYTDEGRAALSVTLPVVMLDALRAQMDLLGLALEAEHLGGTGLPAHANERLLRTLTLRTLVHALWARTRTADTLDGRARADFERASREFDRSWARVVEHLRAMSEGRNPLGIEEVDVPLYLTSDEAGPQQRAFAASDYLLGLAEGAVTAANGAFTRARNAYDTQRVATFVNLNQAAEASRRRTQILTRSGERLQSLCGLSVSEARGALESGEGVDSAQCFLADGCDFTPPNPVGEPEVFYETCRLLQLRSSPRSPHGFRIEDSARRQQVHAFFDDVVATLAKDENGQPRDRAAIARGLRVRSADGGFELSFGQRDATLVLATEELAALLLVVPDAAPVGLPTAHASSSIESFRPADVAQLNVMKPFGDADHACKQQRDERFGGNSGDRQFPPDLDRAECYRGTIGEAALSSRRAQTELETARARLEQFMQNYEISVQQCLFDDAAGQLTAASRERFDEDTKGLKEAVFAMGIVSQVMEGVAGVAAAVMKGPVGIVEGVAKGVQAAANIASSSMQYAIDEEMAKHEARVAEIESDTEKRKCMNEAQKSLVGMEAARLEIVAATQQLGVALLRLHNLQREADNAVASAADDLSNEERAGLPRMTGAKWLSQDLREYERTLRVAKRMVYLALRAAEWESQQTLGAQRVEVMAARTPDQLTAVHGAIQRAQGTRSIPGGNSVGNQYVVVSLRDQLLRMVDAADDAGHEQGLTAVDALRKALTSSKFAVFQGGTYLGQRIPFELVAPDTASRGVGVGAETFSLNNCGERLWSVTLGIDGEAEVSGSSSLTSMELLKHNSFHSQWCTTEGRTDHQSASVAPGRNLFLDPYYESELVSSFDVPSSSEYTRATFSAVRTNVTREEFETQSFEQGRQSGLAGRGLFGQYALFFPASSLRYERCTGDACALENSSALDLSRVNDVLLRFEYVAWAR